MDTTKLDLLMLVFLISFIMCLACDDRWWRSGKYLNTRWWVLMVFNAIGSFAFVGFWYVALFSAPR